MTMRPYQAEAAQAALEWMRRSREPIIIDAATGAGKSHIIAEIARVIHGMTGKRVLCLAPSAELVTQNMAKFLATGNPASMFSASAGRKELRHPVVFGSPLTVKNRISRFKENYAIVILDEAHGITPTVQSIIDAMREGNPNLRVCGLSATPYRLGQGWIFREHADGRINTDNDARDPYFAKCVYKIGARDLISQDFLTPPVIGATGAEGYDTAGLSLNARGQFDADAVDRAYHGHGRKTAAIVADVVAQSRGRLGVMFFAATVQHAHEIMASLPPDLSAIVTGDTPKKERDAILARFKAGANGEAGALKYLVSVSALTTGFDAPHVDVIAILRKTESVGLLQQIIGRGLRLHPGKSDCIILDYTTNIADHCPDGDLFAPEIVAVKLHEGGWLCHAECPTCGHGNEFKWRSEYIGTDGKPKVKTDQNGYVVDHDGYRVRVQVAWDEERDAPIMADVPAHYGRRCQAKMQGTRLGEYVDCSYRWTHKKCPHCDAENDIAARYCTECKGEIVDPNQKLIADFRAMKKDPTQIQTDEVLSMSCAPGISRAGNKTLRVEFVTPYRQFSVWFQPEATFLRGQRDYAAFVACTNDGTEKPRTVTYCKNVQTGFYEVKGYNKPADQDPAERKARHAAE